MKIWVEIRDNPEDKDMQYHAELHEIPMESAVYLIAYGATPEYALYKLRKGIRELGISDAPESIETEYDLEVYCWVCGDPVNGEEALADEAHTACLEEEER